MFAGMEQELLYWKERLSILLKGKSIILKDDESPQSVYSAIRANPELFDKKKFSIRTNPVTLKKSVLRTK